MQKLISMLLALTMLTSLLGCAAAEQQAEKQQPILIYSALTAKPIAAVLPGVPVDVMAEDDPWTQIYFPLDEYGGEYARVVSGTGLSRVLDSSLWPDAVVTAESTSLDSVDLNLNYGSLSKDTIVKVFGRCNGYWYVQADTDEATVMGAVRLNDLEVPAETVELLNSMLPNFLTDSDELENAFDVWEQTMAELVDAYGADNWRWPQNERAAFDDLQWNIGFYWEPSYAVSPTEQDLTAEEAAAAVRRYLAETLLIPMSPDLELNAQFLLDQGCNQPVWHVYWALTSASDCSAEFIVTGDAATAPEEINVLTTDFSVIYNSRECMDWPIETRATISTVAGWRLAVDVDGDGQPIAPGMLDEAIAREKAWQYAADELGFTQLDSCGMSLSFYNVGTVMSYDWPREAWCDERPVFRANFYTDDLTQVLGEIWFDAENGELYRVSRESSGMG